MATPTETVKWVAVPNGYDSSGNLLLSIVVAPELAGGSTGTLADFPDFQDWPSTLQNQSLSFFVNFQKDSTAADVFVTIPTGKLNSTLWKTLFPSTLSYGPPDPIQDRFRSVAVASYPALQISDFVQGQYQSYSPSEVPTLNTLKSVYGPISDVLVGVAQGGAGGAAVNPHFQRLARERAAVSKGGTVPHANDFSAASHTDAFAAQAFYHLPGAAAPPPPGVETVDFHRALTFVGQHGVLQRALGLVFDLAISPDVIRGYSNVFGASVSDVFVSVLIRSGQGLPFTPSSGVTYTEITPRTHCDGSASTSAAPTFEAHPKTANIAPGRQLQVNTPTSSSGPAPYLVHVMDIDTAGLRASSFATQVQLAQAPAAINPLHVSSFRLPDLATTTMEPPMIRSNGLTLTEVNRGVNFATSIARAFSLLDATEAFINDPHASQIPDLTAEDLVRGYVLDVVDTTNNVWRSTAERVATYSSPASSPTVTLSSSTAAPFDEASTQAPPRSQSSPTDASSQQANVSEVVLRYNGWSNAAPRPGKVLQDSDSQATGPDDPFSSALKIDVSPPAGRLPPLRFGHTYAMRARIVDVANNVIGVDQGAGVGDSLGRVSDPMVYGRHEAIGSPDVYSQSSPRLAESLVRLVVRDIDGAGTSMRALAPQRSQEPFAEWHGLFDSGGALDPSSFGSNNQTTYNEIIGRESAHYPEPAVPPAPIDPTQHVPYLPDPLAKGAVLSFVDGSLSALQPPKNPRFFDFSQPSGGSRGGDWPNYKPFSLVLAPVASGGSPDVQFDQANRVIKATINPADTVIAQLSSTCDLADIDLFALKDLFPSGTFDHAEAAAGKYWAITPFVTLEFIYAVQKPLITPEFPTFPAPPRQIGDTFAPLEADLTWSPKSTGKVDLLADWGDPVDDPVHNLPVQGPGAPDPAPRQTSNSPVVTLPSATSPLASAGTQAASSTDRFSARHEFFDTKHRNVTYHGVATSRFTEFYAPGTDVTKTTAHPVLVNIPSSARPDSVKIAYVVPIFSWGLTHSGHTTVSQRSPAALRVFIERPWWSSGIDELLAVTTWHGAEPGFGRPVLGGFARDRNRKTGRFVLPGGPINTAIPSDEALYVTDWGADPVFGSPALPSLHPRLATFTNAVQNGLGLSIEEKDGITVNAAGHHVTFDPVRNLWFCDVAIDMGAAYTPMIRLALARYQPNSVAGVELSRIVLADIMSLDPGRIASVVRKSSHELSSVSLAGFSYSRAAGARNVAPGEAEIVIERRNHAIHDDTLGWEPVGQPIKMNPHGGRSGTTTWVANNVKLPHHGTLRLSINQYEVLPSDNRELTRGFYRLAQRSRELRLLHQDVIPL